MTFSRTRVLIVLVMVLAPMLFMLAFGSYHLWQTGLGFIMWWPMMASMAVGYALARHWIKRKLLFKPVDFSPPELATERDRQAWKLIEKHGHAQGLTIQQLTNVDLYVATAKSLAEDLAKYYHPDEEDGVAALTIPEMLSVIELAARDLHEWFDKTVPGAHIINIRDLRRAQDIAEWYKVGRNAMWVMSAMVDPTTTAARYAASQVGIAQPMDQVQQSLLVWAFNAFVHRMGFYLVELYSGRMRVGAKRWQELTRGEEKDEPKLVSLALFGQVKVGKSSLVNALLGERKAVTDVLPATGDIQRYHLSPPGVDAELILADTPGYAHEGPKADQLDATREIARQADLLLLVLHARNPAREPDVAMLRNLREWFASRPDLKMPPVVAVLTHVDLLSPAMEWQPPYDWHNGERPKERSIREAVEAAREQLGDAVVAVLPVCTADGKIYGVEEGVLPELVARLGEARVVTVLRCLRAEPDRGKIKRVLGQLLQAGKGAIGAFIDRK